MVAAMARILARCVYHSSCHTQTTTASRIRLAVVDRCLMDRWHSDHMIVIEDQDGRMRLCLPSFTLVARTLCSCAFPCDCLCEHVSIHLGHHQARRQCGDDPEH